MARSPLPSVASDAPPKPLSWRGEVIDLVRTLAVGLGIATLLHATVAQPFTIPSASMEPGLVVGDYLVVSKFAYGWSTASLPITGNIAPGRVFGREPRRGDVVVFRLPRDPRQVWIKRVIGLPGDRVAVRDGVPVINDRPLRSESLPPIDGPGARVSPRQESHQHVVYRVHDAGPGSPGDAMGTIVVPNGHYFVMGDNRDDSLDSRWPEDVGVGFLPAENLIGKAEVVVASWRPGAGLLRPWTWLNLRPGRFWKSID